DQLLERLGEDLGVAASNQVLGMDPRGVRQGVVRAGRDCLDRLTRVEVIEVGARQWFAIGGIHCVDSAFIDGNELLIFRADVVGGRADDLVVDTLLDDVGSPAGRACDDEQRGEHGGGYTHHVVRDGGEPVEVGEHLLDVPHHGFQTLGDVEHFGVAGRDGQLAGDFLDDLVARVGNGVDRVAEADDHFLVFHAATDIGLGFVGGLVALLDFEGHFVGTAVLGTTQRTDGTGYGRVHVGTRAGDDAAGERGRVEFVLCVKD